MTPFSPTLLAALLLVGCAEPPETQFEYVLSQEAFELGGISRDDFDLPTDTISLLNLRNDDIRLTVLEVAGDGSDAVEPGISTDFTTLKGGASIALSVSVSADRTLWSTGVFEPALVVQLGRLLDVSSDWDDPDEWVHTEVELPIHLSVACDLDADGEDADECGGGDCDDADAAIYAGATEVCDGADNDCDGEVDVDTPDLVAQYPDGDSDGYGNPDSPLYTCNVLSSYVADATDCDDGEDAVFPGATEVCDGADQDCDGTIDEDAGSIFYADADGDSFGDLASTVLACDVPAGFVSNSADCDDASGAIFPGAAESENTTDDDCDEWVDEDFTAVGALVVSELMVDFSLGEAGLQWFEITNVSLSSLRLDGWEIVATTEGLSTSFFVSPDAALSLPPGAVRVFCQDRLALAGVAPAVGCDYEYATDDNGYLDSAWGPDQAVALRLGGSAGALRLDVGGATVDGVAWDRDALWPVVAGASFALDPAAADAIANDLPDNWCPGSVPYTTDGLTLGSPGVPNDGCPEG